MSEKKADQELIVSRQILSIPQRFSTGPSWAGSSWSCATTSGSWQPVPEVRTAPTAARECAPFVASRTWDELVRRARSATTTSSLCESGSADRRDPPDALRRCWVDLDRTQATRRSGTSCMPRPEQGPAGLRSASCLRTAPRTMEDIKHFEIVERHSNKTGTGTLRSP